MELTKAAEIMKEVLGLTCEPIAVKFLTYCLVRQETSETDRADNSYPPPLTGLHIMDVCVILEEVGCNPLRCV